jgi:hypothetical protein
MASLRLQRTVGCVFLLLSVSVGCSGINSDSEGSTPPPLSKVDWLDEPAPPLPFDAVYSRDLYPRLLARLKLRDSDYSAYLADFVPDRSKPTAGACYLEYVAKGDDDDDLGASQLRCRDLRDVVALDQLPVGDGREVVLGTVDKSIDRLRVKFDECGENVVATYPLRGRMLPTKPSRRIFMLDAGSCSWSTARAFRNGVQVAFEIRPPPYQG